MRLSGRTAAAARWVARCRSMQVSAAPVGCSGGRQPPCAVSAAAMRTLDAAGCHSTPVSTEPGQPHSPLRNGAGLGAMGFTGCALQGQCVGAGGEEPWLEPCWWTGWMVRWVGVDRPPARFSGRRMAGRGVLSVKGAQRRSCSSPVLVQEAAQQVASPHAAWPILASDGYAGRLVWRVASALGAGDAGGSARHRPEGFARGGGAQQSAASPDSQRGRCGPNVPRMRSLWAPGLVSE